MTEPAASMERRSDFSTPPRPEAGASVEMTGEGAPRPEAGAPVEMTGQGAPRRGAGAPVEMTERGGAPAGGRGCGRNDGRGVGDVSGNVMFCRESPWGGNPG